MKEFSLTYKFDLKRLTIHQKDREIYHISRDRCGTSKERLDWVLQVNSKVWMKDIYQFNREFSKALDYWFELDVEYAKTLKRVELSRKFPWLGKLDNSRA